MFPEIGLILFIIALFASIVLIFLQKIISCNHLLWQKKLVQLIFINLSASCLILIYCFYISDLSVFIVAKYSNEKMPVLYKICALWGGHEGAMLLWLWILSAYTFVVSKLKLNNPTIKIKAINILNLIYISFASFMLLTSSPFARLLLNTPTTGQGLNPLLQDIGMAFHPPILYLGYVGLAVVFALTISSLQHNELGKEYAKQIKPFALFAWASLTLGIVLGSWWAYRELGWGGWWFWDPVENASFMPWLIAMGLVHMLKILQKTNKWFIWTAILASLGFILSLLGTFLVRSGVLVSVHAFANDPNRGLILLIYLAIALIVTLWLIMKHSEKKQSHDSEIIYSKNGLMLLGSGLATISMLTVLIGTIYPIISQALFSQTVAVGADYFNQVVTPLFLFAAILTGLATQKFNTKYIKNIIFTIIITTSALLYLSLFYTITIWLILSLFIGFLLLVTSLISFKKTPMTLSHIGFAIVIIAASLTSQLSSRYQWQLSPNQTIYFDNKQLTFKKITKINGKNYTSRQALFVINEQNNTYTLKPEQQLYHATGMAIAKISSHTSLWQDFYLALGQKTSKNTWAVRLMINVAVYWIWVGGLLAMLGMLWACFKKSKV